jgi:hypothetical protein
MRLIDTSSPAASSVCLCRNEPCYQAWLARCLVAAGRPSEAWDLYLGCAASEDSLALLHIVANDCYRCATAWL